MTLTLENECLQNPCSINGKCVDTLESFYCTCKSGFYGDGFKCDNLQNAQCGRRHASDTPEKSRVTTGLTRYRDWPAFLTEKRIVGGRVAMLKDWPWMANLRLSGEDFPFCGASIVNDRFLITAAHCITPLLHYLQQGQLRIYVGDWHIMPDRVKGTFSIMLMISI